MPLGQWWGSLICFVLFCSLLTQLTLVILFSNLKMENADDNKDVCVVKPKKRSQNSGDWKRNVAKRLRNSGESYVSDKTNKHVAAKRRREGCDCVIKNEKAKQSWCEFHTLTDFDKDNLFTGFYRLGDYNLQNSFLWGLIKQSDCKRAYKNKRSDMNKSRRKQTFTYFLKNGDGKDVRVCLKSFLDTFSISKKRVAVVRAGDTPKETEPSPLGLSDEEEDEDQNLSVKSSRPILPHTDKRGKHGNIKKLSDSQTDFVVNHIKKFPRYTSHYSRKKNPNKSFIRSVSSVSEMYKLYLKDYENRSGDDIWPPVKYEKYLSIFNTKFNIGFKLPITDSCAVCDEWKFTDKDLIPYSFRLHQLKAEQGYKLLSDAKKNSESPTYEYCVITYDLQQAMPLPKIPTEKIFYLRQLWVYNLGFHVCNNNKGFMCMWTENTASRGACEIGCCLYKVLLNTEMTENKRKLWFFSDSCSGQNKNMVVFTLYYILVHIGKFDEILHSFLVPGHTFMPSDSDFGVIEKKARKQDYFFCIDDWKKVVTECRVKDPFTVVDMDSSDFLNLKTLLDSVAKEPKSVDKKKVGIRGATSVKVTKNSPGYIFLKYSYSELEKWTKVRIFKKQEGRRRKNQMKESLTTTMLRELLENVPKLYPQGREINALKHRDLLSLLPYIPPVYHDLYKNLKPAKAGGHVEEEEEGV